MTKAAKSTKAYTERAMATKDKRKGAKYTSFRSPVSMSTPKVDGLLLCLFNYCSGVHSSVTLFMFRDKRLLGIVFSCRDHGAWVMLLVVYVLCRIVVKKSKISGLQNK